MAATDATMDDVGTQADAATDDANVDEFEQQLIADGELLLLCF